eukprot:GHVR01022262.1.p1 GENE.GHVR01022262.1~~GHVR01022262.1.p1  ORF type:complete len:256 (-),score=25.54 GHVR01022262.1:61-828(-)
MLMQAQDLLEEGQELNALLDTLTEEDWTKATPFKNWTINQVIQHLHGSDRMAVLALTDAGAFQAAKSPAQGERASMPPVITGTELKDAWWSYFQEMCRLLGESDGKRRVPWFGPDMGVMMFTTARQMETWAHGQDIYDLRGQTRVNTDRLKNIAVIGVKTYGWTFANRGQKPPGPAPYVKLNAPSGATWEFNDVSTENYVQGSAVEFCHVVTQGRNVADVDLTVVGTPAQKRMAIAQCFAGPPETPPAVGSRSSG